MPVDRILVVDDEETIREIVSSMLTTAGYKCRQAGSGMEALALLESGEEFELMLSDLMMANLDGIGLLERTKERFPEMPVVMVTAVHDISVALAAIRNGAYDYLLKPFEREQLLATVRRALENRRLKLENRAYQTSLESLVAARTEQLKKALVDLERSYDITLEALGGALDLKDAETEGHSKRVTAFTIAIARAMGLPKDQIDVIARGAFLHDIGKMAIPDKILTKPGKLTPDEITIMREHCYHGYQILSRIPFLARGGRDCLFPSGAFRRDGIPARTERRADSTGRAHVLGGGHARCHYLRPPLSSRRSPCRRPGKKSSAGRGSNSIPQVVKVFLTMPENIWGDLRRQIGAERDRFAYSTSAKGSV